MVTGNLFHVYLEPDVPNSLFDLIEDEQSLRQSNHKDNDIDIALRIKLVSIDPAEMLPGDAEKEESKQDKKKKKNAKKAEEDKISDVSSLFLVRHNDLYDEEYDLEDILGGLDGSDSDEKSEGKLVNDDEFQEYALVHLGTKPPLTSQFGMNLTLTQETDANMQFVVRGPRGMFITGNYILN